jgi:probable HAF family extracellular repeat protein
MKTTQMLRFARRSALAALVLAAGANAAQTTYIVVDLGAIPASSVCPCFHPTGMSENGHVAGDYFAPSGERRSFRSQGFGVATGQMQDLGTLGGIAQASDVNNSGTVVGYSVTTNGLQRAVKFENGQVIALPTLQGGIHANANAVNNQGWIVGMSQKQVGPDQQQRATLWMPGQGPVDLGSFGGPFAEAFGVNDHGQVVGWAWTTQWNQRAFVWSAQTGMVNLGTLGGNFSTAADINEAGTVIGSSHTATGFSWAFKWTAATGMVQLSTPVGALSTYAVAINNAGQIIGNAFLEDCSTVPLIWNGTQITYLNTLVNPATGWVISEVGDIDDQGRIAASARFNEGPYHAVLLLPAKPAANTSRR